MEKLKHDLLTSKYTDVWYEDNFKFNAPHYFEVFPNVGSDEEQVVPLAKIHFQEGPINEAGVNGVMNEDLIAMVICRLDHFQDSEFYCYENYMAIMKLEEALLWLRKRTMGREQRGVEGTHQK